MNGKPRNTTPPPTLYYRTAQAGGPTSGVDTSARAGPSVESVSGFTPLLVGEYRLVRVLRVVSAQTISVTVESEGT